jgi:hypothetical protein
VHIGACIVFFEVLDRNDMTVGIKKGSKMADGDKADLTYVNCQSGLRRELFRGEFKTATENQKIDLSETTCTAMGRR